MAILFYCCLLSPQHWSLVCFCSRSKSCKLHLLAGFLLVSESRRLFCVGRRGLPLLFLLVFGSAPGSDSSTGHVWTPGFLLSTALATCLSFFVQFRNFFCCKSWCSGIRLERLKMFSSRTVNGVY